MEKCIFCGVNSSGVVRSMIQFLSISKFNHQGQPFLKFLKFLLPPSPWLFSSNSPGYVTDSPTDLTRSNILDWNIPNVMMLVN